jgi:hypothetical protein
MDENRRIRFLVAPMLFIASLLLGACLDPAWHNWIVKTPEISDWPKWIGLIAGGGVVVLAAGYVFGTLTYFILRLLFCAKAAMFGGARFHEVALSTRALLQVWETLGATPVEMSDQRRQELFAGVIFDHSVLWESHKGVHQWLFRRWNGFNTAINSLSGLILSFPVGHHLIGIQYTRAWLLLVGGFAAILVPVLVWAWRDTMKMVEFMAGLPRTQPRLDHQ